MGTKEHEQRDEIFTDEVQARRVTGRQLVNQKKGVFFFFSFPAGSLATRQNN